MARAASLDKKITDYLTQLTIRQKKTLLTVAKTVTTQVSNLIKRVSASKTF